MEIQRFQLSNGIRVVAAPMAPQMPVTLQVLFWGGSRVDTDDEINLAHLTEHIIFLRGGKDFQDVRSVDHEYRLLGETGNAGTSDEFMIYYLVTIPEFLRRAAHLLSDMVIYARLDPLDLEKERGAVLQELKLTVDDPEDFAARKFKQFLFGRHPLGRMDSEAIDVLKRLTVADTRKYKERFYGPPNMVIVAAGGMDPGEAAAILEEYFGHMPTVAKVTWPPFKPDPHGEAVRVLKRKHLEVAYLYVGGFAPQAASGPFRISSLLHEILSHRLWLELRAERGLAYDVSAGSRMHSDIGHFVIDTGVSPEPKIIRETLQIIFQEMTGIKGGNISEEELCEAKTKLRVRLTLGLASSEGVASFLGSHELYMGRAKSPEEIHTEIEEITKDNLVDLAHTLWKEDALRSLLLTTAFPGYKKIFRKLRSVVGS